MATRKERSLKGSKRAGLWEFMLATAEVMERAGARAQRGDWAPVARSRGEREIVPDGLNLGAKHSVTKALGRQVASTARKMAAESLLQRWALD